MRLGSRHAHGQFISNFCVRFSLADRREDLAFPLCKCLKSSSRWRKVNGTAGKLGNQSYRPPRSQKRTPLGNDPNACQKLIRWLVFQEKAAGTEAKGIEDVLIEFEGGHHQ